MRLKTKNLTQTKRWLTDDDRAPLVEVIKTCFANVTANDYLAKYFDDKSVSQRKLRLYYADKKLVGYCLLTFTDEHDAIVIRASAGFFPDYRQGSNTFQFSLSESIKCWLKNPWRKIYYADTMLSPAMYRAIASKVAIVWPHPKHIVSNLIFERFNTMGLVSTQNNLRCLVPVNRISNYSKEELAAFKTSKKLEIEYFQKVNPDFNQGVALFVIIPITLKQLTLTALKYL